MLELMITHLNFHRTRSLIQGSHKNSYCKNYHLEEESEISCSHSMQVTFAKSDWSHCITNDNEQGIVKVNGLSIVGRCGIGSQYMKGDRIDPNTCQQIGNHEYSSSFAA